VFILWLSILTTTVVFSSVLEFSRYIFVLLIALLVVLLLQPYYFLTVVSLEIVTMVDLMVLQNISKDVVPSLQYAWRLGYSGVESKMDLVVIVHVIKFSATNNAMGISLVKNIGRMVDFDWKVIISHSYREGTNV
jgi:hypothetical protein